MSHFDMGNRLAIYGWKGETEHFYYLMAKIWWKGGYADDWRSVEQMLFHPSGVNGAIAYVSSVRAASGLDCLPEEEVLQTLSNLRKNKYLTSIVGELS